MFKKMYAGTAFSNGAIWDEFIEQHQHQGILNSTIFNVPYNFFDAN